MCVCVCVCVCPYSLEDLMLEIRVLKNGPKDACCILA